jgi:hypothetical protein
MNIGQTPDASRQIDQARAPDLIKCHTGASEALEPSFHALLIAYISSQVAG